MKWFRRKEKRALEKAKALHGENCQRLRELWRLYPKLGRLKMVKQQRENDLEYEKRLSKIIDMTAHFSHVLSVWAEDSEKSFEDFKSEPYNFIKIVRHRGYAADSDRPTLCFETDYVYAYEKYIENNTLYAYGMNANNSGPRVHGWANIVPLKKNQPISCPKTFERWEYPMGECVLSPMTREEFEQIYLMGRLSQHTFSDEMEMTKYANELRRLFNYQERHGSK